MRRWAFFPAGGYATWGAEFDGTNDYMTRGADLTGTVDGRKFLASFWILPGWIRPLRLKPRRQAGP